MRLSFEKLLQVPVEFETHGKNKVLEQLYHSYNFSPFSSETTVISEAIHEALTRLVQAIGRVDSQFEGHLQGVGSFFDGTRVGTAPNEFDYLYSLTQMANTIKGHQARGIGKYSFKVEDDHDFSDRAQNLSNILLRTRLSQLIDRTLRTMPLPFNLQHGGISSPFFSGVRKNGPAFTFLFLWTGGRYDINNPLLISVDLTVAIRPAHIPAFLKEESRLADIVRPLPSLNVRDVCLIAHPDQDDVWQMTTGALEVAILSKLQPRMRTTIKLLKILKDLFLTIREGSNDLVAEEERLLRYTELDIAPIKHKMASLLNRARMPIGAQTVPNDHKSYYVHVESATPRCSPTTADIQQSLICTSAARQLFYEKTNIAKQGRDFMDICTMQGEMFKRFVQNEMTRKRETDLKGTSEFEFFTKGEEVITEFDSEVGLEYLQDFLPPHLSRLALEECKPVITLKSCAFKYVLINLLLSEKVQQGGFPEDRIDMELLILMLKEIRKSKQVQHPLLGHTIQTYSVCHRVYSCAATQKNQNCFEIESRLSNLLYCFLDVLIEALESNH